MDISSKFAAFINEKRWALGLSYRAIGKLIGMEPRNIGRFLSRSKRWYTATMGIRLETADKMLKAVNSNWSEFHEYLAKFSTDSSKNS